MARDTGFPRADAETDFLRVRRGQALSRLAAWLRRELDDVNIILPYGEVIDVLGYLGQRRLGTRVIPLDSAPSGQRDTSGSGRTWFITRSA